MKRSLKGSEKQIKWASGILTKVYDAIEENDRAVHRYYKDKQLKRWNRISSLVLEYLDSLDNSVEIINKYKSISYYKVRKAHCFSCGSFSSPKRCNKTQIIL